METTCELENGEGCVGVLEGNVKGKYFIVNKAEDCKSYNAKITWKWCNDNNQVLQYNKKQAAVHFGEKNKENNEKSLYDFAADVSIAPNSCEEFDTDVVLDSCIKGAGKQWSDIILQGILPNQDRCYCYQFNQHFSLITDEPTPTASPTSKPTSKGNYCDGSDLMIVTVADPVDNKDARYIELYSKDCKGKIINSDIALYRQNGRSYIEPLRLQGHQVWSDGAIVICVSGYWGNCDYDDGTGALVAAVDGINPIILKNDDNIQDRYGFDNNNIRQSYEDGGSVRICENNGPQEFFQPIEWDITPGSGFGTRKAETFSPGYWKSCCDDHGIPLCPVIPEGCYPSDILFTEFADPVDTPSGRYVEMYSKLCAGQTVGGVDLVRIPSEKWFSLDPPKWSLEGKEFDHDGFMVVCMTIDANTVYGRGKCDYFAAEVANADGTSTFKLVGTSEKVLDIYGRRYSLSDVVPQPLPSDFSEGRAVRNQRPLADGIVRNTEVWFPVQWMISKSTYLDMDPGEWVDPPPTLLLTEISYPSDSDLHFIEISSPNLQGTKIRDSIYVVTYSHGSSTPDLHSVSLFDKQVGHDGFLLICATDYVSAAYHMNNACDILDSELGDLNNFDAIAIVEGIVDGPHPHFDILDVYGVIGSYSPIALGAGRAVRKIFATSPRPEYVRSDWIKMRTNEYLMSNPRDWIYEKPTIIDDDDVGCNIDTLIITEIADPVDDKMGRFIEVYCPLACSHGKILGDFTIVSHTGSDVGVQLNAVSLKGYRLDSNGFLVICVGQSLFSQRCDAFAGVGSVVDNDGTHAVAIRYRNTIIDVYGSAFAASYGACITTSGSGFYTGTNWHCFTNGRVVRRKTMMTASVSFTMDYWVISQPIYWYICDPGVWTDPYCFVCDLPPVVTGPPKIYTHYPTPAPVPYPTLSPYPPSPPVVPHSTPAPFYYPPQPVCSGYHCCPVCYPGGKGKGKGSKKATRRRD